MLSTRVGLRRGGRQRPALDFAFATTGALDSRITLSRASSATFFDAAGMLQTASTNAARIDYDPVTLACRGLLMEEARANLLATPAAPATQSVTVTAQAYTLSFYGTGSVVLSGTAAGTVTGSGAFPARRVYTFTPTAGTLTLTISGAVQFANLEPGSYPTSYIPSASRAADTASIPSTSVAGLSPGQGTLAVEWLFPGILPAGQAAFLGFDDGTGTNRVLLRVGQGAVADMVSSPGGIDTTGFAASANTIIRQAVAWSSGSSAHAMGAQIETSPVATMPAALTRLLLGGGTGSFWLRRVRAYPARLPNGILQSLAA